ncbi:SgrR family transcriptional regulator [Vibrio navarrensis]|uniref:SgrR family transcriptional regulator n=1 Tax=Vibrio navarrensis TaxID=29495 RepID=A0AAI9G850_9VIBR|nr:SgrR family transcriptional regulator [Vibrio navarrensis]EGR2795860.1 SgrR family transcriptional regulator [Vibrio navarrensis]EHA1124307.1 SgrR family transcriptional regulator [Vibrio navarrensis]EKA5637252.1 SgrR family transcriptional regulator [Vibrio navarrensis]ELN6932032.1 SgrR family transcriptional regulator [Vibrio navarrensis]KGK14588.1 transcriptional regulator [Vibrio navarrensis]
MSSPRLRVQFETLFQHFDGKNSGVQLEDITEILFCTRRNARIVLNKLEEEGWIEWHPAAGRGKLSTLIFKRSKADVSENLARRYLEEGKIGQALEVLDSDAAKLTQVIQGYLGVSHREGEQVVRLPYYRPLSMLNPHLQMRRTEIHIARQIFSGLTKLDDNDLLQPDLAHTWEMLSKAHWRFYLRPGVRFHNGELLTTEMVLESLRELHHLNLFAHVQSVSSPSPWVVDIRLFKDDLYLPLALSESQAKILLPQRLRSEDYHIRPVGTGPYMVQSNDDKRLILRAFDGYFGFRPLLDQVEVWVIDESYSSMVYPSLSKPIMNASSRSDEVELDPGCTFLLLNKRSGVAKDPRWAEFFSAVLNGYQLFSHVPQDKVIELGLLQAYGIKPGWIDLYPNPNAQPPGELERISVAYQAKHPMFPVIAKTIKTILKRYRIEVDFVKYDCALEKPEEVDIWLKAMGIATNREDALAGWLLDYSNIESMSTDYDFQRWLALVESWRSGVLNDFPAREIGKQLVKSFQVIPMFHCWLGVNKDHSGALQNAKCNALGWFDFSQVWVKPDLQLENEN